jgi:molybdenum cofactor sulfurtransferase
VFTSGATASLKLVAESFVFGEGGVLAYMRECHTSAVGARGVAHSRGVPAFSFTESDIAPRATVPTIAEGAKHAASGELNADDLEAASSDPCTAAADTKPQSPSLVVFPGQSNFCGRKYPLQWVTDLRTGEADVQLSKGPVCPTQEEDSCAFCSRDGNGDAAHGATRIVGSGGGDGGAAAVAVAPMQHRRRTWRVLLDAAALVSTSPLNLAEVPADFVALSFYKMFGFPTGLGALVVRNESARLLGAKT